jgi:cytochrome c oxidase assembly protein subunit 15
MLFINFNNFKRLILIAMIIALCVVVLGAYVRLTDAGLGCPDWPGCYGTMTVPESQQAIQKAQTIYPEKLVDVGKAWREMAHRYLAGTLGLLILAIFIISLKLKKEHQTSFGLTTLLLLLVTFQAMLGMWTVTMLLKPAIVTAHLIGGMSTLALLTWLTHRYWGHSSATIIPYPNTSYPIRIGLLILLMQVFLGGWTSTNYAALACTDFPTCHGAWWPSMNFSDGFTLFRELGQNASGSAITLEALTAIQWSHRIGAVVTFCYLVWLSFKLLQYWQLARLTMLLLFLLCVQIALGIANLILHLPLILAVSHNLVAALLVVVMVVLNSKVTSKY